jgi:hypothetical protein
VEETKKILSNLVSRANARAGDDSICALAATADYIIKKIALHGTETLSGESKKTLKSHHMTNDDIEKLSVWPFLRTLNCVKNERVAYATRLSDIARKKVEKKEKDKVKKAAAKAGELDPATKKTDIPSETLSETACVVSGESDDDEKDNTKSREKLPCNSFCHHVYNIARDIVKDAVEGDVSSEVRRFGSCVVYELIERYAKLIRLQIQFAGVKTIKANTVITISKIIMTDAGVEDAELEKYVNDRVDLYYAHIAASKDVSSVETPTSVAIEASPVTPVKAPKPSKTPKTPKANEKNIKSSKK